MSEEIPVVAIFHPIPGKESRLKEVLNDLALKVYENEKGVTKYQMFEQINSESGENVILFQETYSNKVAADVHLSAPYFNSVKTLLSEEALISKPFEVIVLKPVGGFASR